MSDQAAIDAERQLVMELRTRLARALKDNSTEYVRGREDEQRMRAMVENSYIESLKAKLAAAKAPYLLSCPWCMVDLSEQVKAYQFMHLINHGDNYRAELAAAKAEIAVRDKQITQLLETNDKQVIEIERLRNASHQPSTDKIG